MTDKKLPSPEEIQKEFEEFVHKRFGNQIQVITHELPLPADSRREATSQKKKKDTTFKLEFNYKPRDIKEELDRFIIRQDEAKKVLAIAVCDHYNQVKAHHANPTDPAHDHYSKQNVLLLGPTGVGKTYIIKQIAKLIGVPFVKADATRFSETGYMGANVEDMVKDLVSQADGDIKKAEYGIIYLDEADKLATQGGIGGRDVSGRGVQLGLLKLMEETEVDLRASHDPASQMQTFLELQQKGRIEKHIISTRHILFIVSGAFTGLEEIISKRMKQNVIGFSSSTEDPIKRREHFFQQVTTKDLIDYGFEPEFVGRLPVRVACHSLNEDDLFKVLHVEGSILSQYKRAFQAYGINLSFSEGALKQIATTAFQEQTGARGLMSILERALRDFKFELPSSSVTELHISEAVFHDPTAAFETLLREAIACPRDVLLSVRKFEEDFKKNYEISISLTKEAIEFLFEKSQSSKTSIDALCTEILGSYAHGLKLVEHNTGQKFFLIDRKIIEHSKEELERLVKESYNSTL